MSDFQLDEHPVLADMVARLRGAGDRLLGVLLYGTAAHGEAYEDHDYHLLIVLADLELSTLERIGDPVKRWVRKGQPMPRFFTPGLIEDASDVFPIEFLDIRAHHLVLHGEDPMAELAVRRDHLRLQCERELREKMMRLREAYLEAEGSERKLRRLLSESYPTFVNIFRGCLLLEQDEVPAHNAEVVTAFCKQADLDAWPFQEIERIERGGRSEGPVSALVRRYYAELTKAVSAVDRFTPQAGGNDS